MAVLLSALVAGPDLLSKHTPVCKKECLICSTLTFTCRWLVGLACTSIPVVVEDSGTCPLSRHFIRTSGKPVSAFDIFPALRTTSHLRNCTNRTPSYGMGPPKLRPHHDLRPWTDAVPKNQPDTHVVPEQAPTDPDENTTRTCSRGHVHSRWPASGPVAIEKCERYCWYCGLVVKNDAATLRKVSLTQASSGTHPLTSNST